MTLFPVPVNELMIQAVGPQVGPWDTSTGMGGWAEMKLGLPLQGFVFGDRDE